ncbi:MAG: hypothetical protein MJZ77_04850 [Bacteroidales bacterium]|nr:hypothetical protein [Bacteroidales bacterium]
MKKFIFAVAVVILFAACEKPNENKFTWEDPGISWTDYNSVYDVYAHFVIDTNDYFRHLGDTILIEAYLVDHMMDHGICLEDDTVDIFRSNCIMPLGTPDSVIDWANHNFNKKVYFTGRLSYSRQLAVLSIVQLSHIDIRLKDEPL